MSSVNEALREQPRGIGLALPRLLGDEPLARLAAAGDERAFAAIYRRYGGELHRYCRAILGSSEDAADALQNTMVSALRALPGERREIALKPWLFRVAHNEAISLLRQRRSGDELDPEQLTVPGAEAGAATAERLRRLVRDLGQLPDRQRGALVMRELNGISCEEIGASLGCTASAARQLIYEARIALQEIAEGREMHCELIRRAISERDGRMLRARRLRAHLRDARRALISRRGPSAARTSPSLPRSCRCRPCLGYWRAPGSAAWRRRCGHRERGCRARRFGCVQVRYRSVRRGAIGAGAAQVGGVVDPPGLSDREAGGERSGSSAPAEGAGRNHPQLARADRPPVGSTPPPPGFHRQARPRRARRGHRTVHDLARPGEPAAGSGERTPRPGEDSAAQGTTPPDQAAPPAGQSLTSPGQVKTPPGQSPPPPVHAQLPPGQSQPPPGQAQTPPGQTTTPSAQPRTPPGLVKPEPQPRRRCPRARRRPLVAPPPRITIRHRPRASPTSRP